MQQPQNGRPAPYIVAVVLCMAISAAAGETAPQGSGRRVLAGSPPVDPLAVCRTQLRTTQAQLKTAQTTATTCSTQLKTSQTTATTCNTQLNSCLKKTGPVAAAAEDALAACQQNEKTLTAQLAAARAEVAQLKRELAATEALLVEARAAADTLNSEREATRTAEAEARLRADQAEADVEECREDLGAAQATAASWQVQKEQLQAAYTECMAASTSNTAEVASLHNRVLDLEHAAELGSQALGECRKELSTVQKNYEACVVRAG